MAREIRTRFSDGVLKPLGTVDLKEGEEVRVIIPERSTGKGMIEALRASAGGWKGLLDAEELKRNIYADRLISTRPEPKDGVLKTRQHVRKTGHRIVNRCPYIGPRVHPPAPV